MSFRKLSANFVFDGCDRMIRNGILVVAGDGTITGLREPASGAREEAGTEFYNGIITPGFINAHCHLELSHLKDKTERGSGLDRFISTVIRERDAPEETIAVAMRQADESMRREGIVAAGDISNSEASFRLKASGSIQYHTFIELFGLGSKNAAGIYRKGKALLALAREGYHLNASLTPHSGYAVSPELLRMISENHTQDDVPLSVHNQESDAENEFTLAASGKLYELYRKSGMDMQGTLPRKMNSLPWLMSVTGDRHRMLLVHNVFTTLSDIEDSGLNPQKTWWCLCPASNAYITGSVPNAWLVGHYPHRICIGTDSLASNDRLSVLYELILLQAALPGLNAGELLRFACLNGAEALGMEKSMGTFEKGKRPGVNLIRKADLLSMKLTVETTVKKLM